jgi:membrane protein implicated in regulation of membrane protease activity
VPWWIWIVGGLILGGLEAVLSGGELYLLFVGAAAIVVGFVDLGGGDSLTTQLFVFCAVAGGSLIFFRRRLSDRLKSGAVDREVDTFIGERARAVKDLSGGGEGKVELRGALWNARNLDGRTIVAGQACRVEKVEGLTLWVRSE